MVCFQRNPDERAMPSQGLITAVRLSFAPAASSFGLTKKCRKNIGAIFGRLSTGPLAELLQISPYPRPTLVRQFHPGRCHVTARTESRSATLRAHLPGLGGKANRNRSSLLQSQTALPPVRLAAFIKDSRQNPCRAVSAVSLEGHRVGD